MPRRRFNAITNTIVGILIAVAIPVLWWWATHAHGSSDEGPSRPAASHDQKAAESRMTAAATSRAGDATAPVVSEAYVETDTFGSLLVHVVWAGDKEPATGIRCVVVPAGRTNGDLEGQRFATGADGTFRVAEVRSGRVELRFDAGVKATAVVKPGTETETTVELEPGVMIEGIVVDQAAKPVARASVYVGYHDGWIFAPDAFFQDPPVAKSGEDGTFRFRLAREQKESLESIGARAEGFAPSPTQFIYSRSGAVIRVRLTLGGPAGGIVGRVVGPDGRGVVRATVMAGHPGGDGDRLPDGTLVIDRDAFRATTDADGRFQIAGVKPGATEIEARAPGFCCWLGSLDVEARPTAIEIRLTAGIAVSGTVVDRDKKPVPGAEVRVFEPFGGLGMSRTSSGPGGAFRLDGLAAGSVQLSAFEETRGFATTKLELAAGADARWDAVLSSGKTLRGRLLDTTDAPLPGWKVSLYPTSGEDGYPNHLASRKAVTNAEGRFAIPNLGDAEYRLMASSDPTRLAYPEVMRNGVRVTDEELVIRIPAESLPTAFVTGIVTDGNDRPVGGAMVTLWPAPLPTIAATALTDDATGRFKIGPVAPRTYGIDIETRGFAPLRLEPRAVEAGATLDLGNLKLDRPGFLKAKLRRDDGSPLTGVNIRVIGLRAYGDTVRIEGDVARSTLGAGKYRLFVMAEDVAGTETPFEIRPGEETILDVLLKAGIERTVTFTVAEGAARPVSLHIVLKDTSGRVLRELDNFMFYDDKTWWYPRLVPGTYRVEAKADNGLKASGSIVVKDLAPSDQPIDFRLE